MSWLAGWLGELLRESERLPNRGVWLSVSCVIRCRWGLPQLISTSRTCQDLPHPSVAGLGGASGRDNQASESRDGVSVPT